MLVSMTETTETRYRVVCMDGKVRHGDLFETQDEAHRFAWWGHCCTANHDIQEIDEEAK